MRHLTFCVAFAALLGSTACEGVDWNITDSERPFLLSFATNSPDLNDVQAHDWRFILTAADAFKQNYVDCVHGSDRTRGECTLFARNLRTGAVAWCRACDVETGKANDFFITQDSRGEIRFTTLSRGDVEIVLSATEVTIKR